MATKGETLEVWGEINQGTNIHVILYIYTYITLYIYIYTHTYILYIREITSKDLLYSIVNPMQFPVITYMRKESFKK